MAKKPNNKKAAAKAAKRGGKGKKRGLRYYLWLLSCVGVSIVFLPTTVILAFGLIPTLVAIMIDKSTERTAGITVGAMNFAGCMPFMVELWKTDHSLQTAYDLLLDPTAFMVMYGGAAVGWIIYFNVPPIVSMYLVRRYEARVRSIDKRMEMLEEIWGGEVRGKVMEDEEEEEIQEILEGDAPEETPAPAAS